MIKNNSTYNTEYCPVDRFLNDKILFNLKNKSSNSEMHFYYSQINLGGPLRYVHFAFLK